jgi:hypothetical protein
MAERLVLGLRGQIRCPNLRRCRRRPSQPVGVDRLCRRWAGVDRRARRRAAQLSAAEKAGRVHWSAPSVASLGRSIRLIADRSESKICAASLGHPRKGGTRGNFGDAQNDEGPIDPRCLGQATGASAMHTGALCTGWICTAMAAMVLTRKSITTVPVGNRRGRGGAAGDDQRIVESVASDELPPSSSHHNCRRRLRRR